MVGGRYGKVKGFNFYIQKNERLKPVERRKLLSESEPMISKLINEEVNRVGSVENINSQITFLDPSNSDMELMEIWNGLYRNYGYRFDRFKSKWEKNSLGKIKDFGNKKDETNSLNPLKIDWLEKRKKKLNLTLGF